MSRKELLKGMTRVGEAQISVFNFWTGRVRHINRVVYQDNDGAYFCIHNRRLVPIIEDANRGE